MEKAGPFQLIGSLATGGMAEVFLARRDGPAGFEKLAVVKRILPQFAEDPDFRRMFVDEARLAARINHPNVVQIFELSESRSAELFLAMEYVAGFDLSRVMDASLKQRRLVPSPVAARMVADAAAGLDFAHRLTDLQGRPQGIVHRDISPENLLVSEVGQVKVVDFGIARANTGAVMTSGGRLKGKMHYHSPEHIQGLPLDGRADVYALGVVLYELVCARRPFEGRTEAEVMQATIDEDPPPPSSHYAAADPELAAVALRALSRDRTHRPTSGQLRDELETWLRTHPCSAADVERFLLEVIPLDSPDRTKARRLLSNAPARRSPTPDAFAAAAAGVRVASSGKMAAARPARSSGSHSAPPTLRDGAQPASEPEERTREQTDPGKQHFLQRHGPAFGGAAFGLVALLLLAFWLMGRGRPVGPPQLVEVKTLPVAASSGGANPPQEPTPPPEKVDPPPEVVEAPPAIPPPALDVPAPPERPRTHVARPAEPPAPAPRRGDVRVHFVLADRRHDLASIALLAVDDEAKGSPLPRDVWLAGGQRHTWVLTSPATHPDLHKSVTFLVKGTKAPPRKQRRNASAAVGEQVQVVDFASCTFRIDPKQVRPGYSVRRDGKPWRVFGGFVLAESGQPVRFSLHNESGAEVGWSEASVDPRSRCSDSEKPVPVLFHE